MILDKEDVKLVGGIAFVRHSYFRDSFDAFSSDDMGNKSDSLSESLRVQDDQIVLGGRFGSDERFVSTWEEAASDIRKLFMDINQERAKEKEKNRPLIEAFEALPLKQEEEGSSVRHAGDVCFEQRLGIRDITAFLAEDIDHSTDVPDVRVTTSDGKIVWYEHRTDNEYSADSWEEAAGSIRPLLLRVKAEIAEEEEKKRPLLEAFKALPSMQDM